MIAYKLTDRAEREIVGALLVEAVEMRKRSIILGRVK